MRIWKILITEKLTKFHGLPLSPISAVYFYDAFAYSLVYLMNNGRIEKEKAKYVLENREILLDLYFFNKISTERIKETIINDEKTIINAFYFITKDEPMYVYDEMDIKERIPDAWGYQVFRPE